MTQLFYPNFTQAPCIPVKFLYNRNILCRFPAKISQTIPSGALTGLNPPRHPLEAPSPTPSASRPRNFFPISSYQHPGRPIPQSSHAAPTAPVIQPHPKPLARCRPFSEIPPPWYFRLTRRFPSRTKALETCCQRLTSLEAALCWRPDTIRPHP